MIYTAITAGKDDLKPRRHDTRYVAFLDEMVNTDWDVLPAYDRFCDPVRNAKIHKVLPHRFFDTDVSLWIDGTFEVLVDFEEIRDYLKGNDIVVFKHDIRNCAYDEATTCINYGLDRRAVIQAQTARYKSEGYPEKNGLHECNVILRRHNKRVEAFNELWWREIEMGSRRDQISFDYCVWRTGVKVGEFEGNSHTSHLAKYTPHNL